MMIQITIVKRGVEYFASRTFPQNMPNFAPEGTEFTITEDVPDDGLSAFEEKAKQEARRRGIKRVINLD